MKMKVFTGFALIAAMAVSCSSKTETPETVEDQIEQTSSDIEDEAQEFGEDVADKVEEVKKETKKGVDKAEKEIKETKEQIDNAIKENSGGFDAGRKTEKQVEKVIENIETKGVEGTRREKEKQ